MAHLEVQPRKKNPAWIWLILGLVIIVAIMFLLMRSSNNNRRDIITTTDTVTTADTGNMAPAADTAGTQP
ncbi:hypothetical protein SAMN05660461_3309 [Chitinophaga ginsengisegetis]|uniref:Uncharacterized protein n=1 Tax=Chitinophaga ginsengisegetis TaxID=393003 RepID=A0A1T5P176_9BACT|nr:hypothetical protein [Chitinophaga ginsengisegetis]SKD06108.1 hypothetical protein SAMN05660461_3309 [Chitinophaga ginsengisegetis]